MTSTFIKAQFTKEARAQLQKAAQIKQRARDLGQWPNRSTE